MGAQAARSNETDPTRAPSPTLEQQAAFFHTFGALRVPGLFADEINTIANAFDEIFRTFPGTEVDPAVSLHKVMDPEYGSPRRHIAVGFIERHPDLAALKNDPRLTMLAHALLGDGCAYAYSTGNIFNSYIYWHSDYFRSAVPPEIRLKFAFYLDELDAESGALRVIPGTNHLGSFREALFDEARGDAPGHLERVFGVAEEDLPGWALAVRPGDLVVFNNTTLHANFNGGPNRRMFSIQFAQAPPDEPGET